MNRQSLILALALTLAPISYAHADSGSAAARYEADKKLCADESSADLRMKCLRDARAEYDKATGTATTSCADCGQVVSVTVGEKKGKASALGLVGGGVAGALVGSQIGHGTGNTVATIAGAAGGAYAGKKIEEHVRTTKYWAVRVRMDNGTERTINLGKDPGLAEGDLVTVAGNKVVRR